MNKELYLKNLETAIMAEYGVSYYTLCSRYAVRLIDNGLPVVFDISHFARLIGINKSALLSMVFRDDLFYSTAQIPKKSGGVRQISIPSVDLKYIQRWILDNILSNIAISKYAFGFQKNVSISDNAKIHLQKKCVLNLDLKDFFPSISFERIFRIFVYYGYTKEVSFLLAKLCTFKSMLPQGSPASPYISNICCLKLDARLSGLAKKYDADYSRYADDITFSGNHDLRSILEPVKRIIQEEGFSINSKKTRIAYPHQRQEVTGLIVNSDHITIPRRYLRSLLQELYYCKIYGVSDHLQRIHCSKTFYKEHVYGKIYFVNSIDPSKAIILFKLADQIDWDY